MYEIIQKREIVLEEMIQLFQYAVITVRIKFGKMVFSVTFGIIVFVGTFGQWRRQMSVNRPNQSRVFRPFPSITVCRARGGFGVHS